jgi:GAF domain-containing protein
VPLEASPFPVELLEGAWTVHDVDEDERLSSTAREMLAEMDTQSLVSIPLDAGGRYIGQVIVLSDEPGSFSPASMRLFEMLGDDAPAALERAQLLEKVQRDARQEENLRRVVYRIRESADIEQALRAAAGELSETIDVPRVSIELDLDTENGPGAPGAPLED